MRAPPLLYYITDRHRFPGDEATRRRTLITKIAEAARAGVDYIQLREKDLCARELQGLAADALAVVRSESRTTRLLVNSRLDVALAVGSDGVHLRSDDISPAAVRSVISRSKMTAADRFLIGISCHSEAEVRKAAAVGASFAVFGPVFEKLASAEAMPMGLLKLKEACRHGIPVLALGGVTVENAPACLETGASGVAGIRLFQDHEVAKVVERLRG
jgi:thiamine-phosphate pyrophosphorylase